MNFPDLLTLPVGPTPWIVGGCCLLAFSLVLPNPPIVALGLASLVTAIAAVRLPTLPSQLLICSILAAVFTLVMRGLLPQESKELAAAPTARVCDAIAPGELGRVHYEGAIWHARCQISDVAIAPQTQVRVIERQGNTLIVLPMPPARSTTD
ncbi:NfeD family protein [Leptolyngbya iicbica]|uniref:NfeD family protein n=2 Tax=Cyanophyceae TaxID=3028117 RepID=A0A4Q7EG44_9CYAN|nr:NfeD family protein [Leptolyngbya sp. LK]RZM82285.1 NfeD family protein [Leptolyngbya sp. LK]